VRNDGFAEAAEAIQGPMRKIFIEFLERSCTAGASAQRLLVVTIAAVQVVSPCFKTRLDRKQSKHTASLPGKVQG
jgi:magnesium-protoporphyrin IX monomethyl ester (oxidative) cyclase